MNEDDKKAVEFLRENAKDLLTEKYDRDFNLLRWAQGYGFDHDESLAELRRHLKFRNYYDLDNVHVIKEHEILKKYFPIGLVGETGQDNNLLVVECAGKIDLMGILKSVHLSDFLIQRYRFQERMLGAMNDLEDRTGKQAAVIYILDLEGLKFDPSLLSIVTGPYRILWASVYTNYPEWISKMFIINAPSFMTLLWKAIGPLLPERTRNKVQICTANSDWKSVVLKHVKPEYLPKHWGGKLVDKNGDGMCRQAKYDAIPQELYWNPCREVPTIEDLKSVTLSAGKSKICTFVVQDCDEPIYIVVNRYCERTYGQGIWYDEDKSAIDKPLEEMVDWCPDFDYPGMPTVDYLRLKVPGPGVYKLKWSNEQAWFRSLVINYRIRFQNENKINVNFEEIDA
ncbi:hypothetical protein WR25_09095 [Diploscapter pachys]|uniref:CRAL-TRIO domain-containing protein n=1 Tax=Diploscapter pachys TaxID=2018661 RepID=A0A2A2LPL5_9BILA|nr:hypothetical protein WR25_09095 [Diploscapter pachys]